jgi:uncharacterized membrane protein
MAFLEKHEEQKVVAAIQKAETNSSGEIRVHLEKKCPKKDPIARAKYLFQKLQMHKTELRNGVIIYVATEDHLIAIWGDEGIHKPLGQDYWDSTLAQMTLAFKLGNYCQGLVEAVSDIGEKLRAHFPFQADDKNELDDSISYGE